MRKIIGVLSACILFVLSGITYGYTGSQNGVTYTEIMYVDTLTKSLEVYSNYSMSTAWGTMTGHSGDYDYAEDGTSSGWVDIKRFKGPKLLQVDVTACSGLTWTGRLYGRLGDSGNGAKIGSDIVFTTVGSTYVNIANNWDWIRFGANIDAIGTDTASVIINCDSGVP